MAQVSNIIYTIYTSSRSKNKDILKNNNNKGHHMSDGPGLKYCSHNCGNQKYISNNCEMLTKIRLVFFFFFLKNHKASLPSGPIPETKPYLTLLTPG